MVTITSRAGSTARCRDAGMPGTPRRPASPRMRNVPAIPLVQMSSGCQRSRAPWRPISAKEAGVNRARAHGQPNRIDRRPQRGKIVLAILFPKPIGRPQ